MSYSETIRKRPVNREIGPRKRPKPTVDAAVLHCIPPNIVPLVQPPFHESSFFVDLDARDNPKIDQQTTNIVSKYPPPPPPPLPDQSLQTTGGIMVPFIFPPPPVVTLELKQSLSPRRRLRGSDHDAQTYVELPPLPFPPPNYMPYPLLSDKSSLAPSDVVRSFLDALDNLPRTNMVVASAAGSLLEMMHQAKNEGLTIEDFENGNVHKSAELDAEHSEVYMEYASNVDVSESIDFYANTKMPRTVDVHSDKYTQLSLVAPRTSSDRRRTPLSRLTDSVLSNLSLFTRSSLRPSFLGATYSEPFHSDAPTPSLSYPSKDVVTANGVNKERRREELIRSSNQLASFESRHRDQIYQFRKQELQQQLASLNASKILLSDSSLIANDELSAIQRELEFQRDFEVYRLRVGETYQLASNVQFFYENCDRAYKRYNSTVLAKLRKLENFYEYQYNLFNLLLGDPSSDVFDIKTKELGKLYLGISHRNFGAEIKQKDVPVKPGPLIHDFMPMTTLAEFELITGDGPSKTKQNNLSSKDAKSANFNHTIFKNPLYDPASSSDTNHSEFSASTPPTPKRRGRRAATSLGTDKNELFDKLSKHSEAALIARIMKNFVGPQGSRADELTTDLEQMGITTRWPV